MQTPSHFLITAVLDHANKKRPFIPISTPALLLGSVLPDIPFALLTLGYSVYYRWFEPLPVDEGSVMEYLHMTLFFTDPVWIIAHNMFHSLVINGLLMGIGLLLFRRWARWGAALFWLAASMSFHTIIDIFTHTSDGPLFLFPLNVTYRFASPISYWEAGYLGNLFFFFEIGLDVLLLAYLGRAWYRKRRR